MRVTKIGFPVLVLSILILACITAASPAAEQRIFETRDFYLTGDDPRAVVLTDVDRDGWLDLASVSHTPNRVSVQRNNGDGSFGDPVNYYGASGPVALCSGDLDGNGFTDLATANQQSNTVTILLNDGSGLFTTSFSFHTGGIPNSMAVGDLDNDSHLDLVTTSAENQGISILRGNGDGTFQAAEHHTLGGRPQSVAIGDLDGDGTPDLVVARGVSHDVSILLGDGGGGYHTPVTYPTGGFPAGMTIGDLEGDGIPDLAVACVSLDSVAVFTGNGDGTFGEADHHDTANGPREVIMALLDQDQYPDLAVACEDNGSIDILINDASGFSPGVTFEAGNPTDLAAGDVDGDGRSDLAATDRWADGVSVLFGRGDGTLQSPLQYAAGDFPLNMVTGDLNDDGHIDLVAANRDGGDLSVFLGTGDGTFLPEDRIGAGDSSADALTLGEFNGDGRPDLAVTFPSSYSTSLLRVYLGDGAGGFSLAEYHDIAEDARGVAAGDLDNDGDQDLAVAYGDYGTGNPGWVDILLGGGDGHFSPLDRHLVGGTPTAIIGTDFDLDGNLDLATVNYTGGNVSVLLGYGDGTFKDAAHYAVSAGPQTLSCDDVNLDGIPDLVTSGYLALLPGRGDGTFDPAVFFDGLTAQSTAIADMDRDGFPDLLSVNGDGLNILIGTGSVVFEPVDHYACDPYCRAIAPADLDGNGLTDVTLSRSGENVISVMINILDARGLVAGLGPAAANSPLVRVFPPGGSAVHRTEFTAYGTPKWGVNVGSGDVDGDETDEILTGPGPGEVFGPHVRGYTSDGTPLPGLSFLAYGTNKYGVNVAAGDFDGDGFDEILTGAGPGAVFGPHVRAFDYDSGPTVAPMPGVSFFAYGTLKWGVNVAAGDLDGDGYDEIVTGAGPGAVFGPHVRGWNVDGGTATAIQEISYFAYNTLRYGVVVSCGDVDGDGIDEIVTGPGPSPAFGAHVRGWNYDGTALSQLPGLSFFAWPAGDVRYGANVWAGTDLDTDGRSEIIVGGGPDPGTGSMVKVFDYLDGQVTLDFSLETFPPVYTHGVNVAAGRF